MTIDLHRAIKLRGHGLTWRRIGITLSREDGRELPYLAGSVADVVNQWIKRRKAMNQNLKFLSDVPILLWALEEDK